MRAPRWVLGASRRGRSPCTHTHTGRSVPARPAAWLPFKAELGFPRSVRTACRHFGSRAVSDTARDLPARSSPGPADGIAAAWGWPCPAPSTQNPAPSLFQNAFCSAGGVDLPSPGLDPAALHPGWHKAALQKWLSHRPRSIFWQLSPNFANFPPTTRAGPSTVTSLSSSLSKSEAKSSPGFVLVLSSPTPLCISSTQLRSGAWHAPLRAFSTGAVTIFYGFF